MSIIRPQLIAANLGSLRTPGLEVYQRPNSATNESIPSGTESSFGTTARGLSEVQSPVTSTPSHEHSHFLSHLTPSRLSTALTSLGFFFGSPEGVGQGLFSGIPTMGLWLTIATPVTAVGIAAGWALIRKLTHTLMITPRPPQDLLADYHSRLLAARGDLEKGYEFETAERKILIEKSVATLDLELINVQNLMTGNGDQTHRISTKKLMSLNQILQETRAKLQSDLYREYCDAKSLLDISTKAYDQAFLEYDTHVANGNDPWEPERKLNDLWPTIERQKQRVATLENELVHLVPSLDLVSSLTPLPVSRIELYHHWDNQLTHDWQDLHEALEWEEGDMRQTVMLAMQTLEMERLDLQSRQKGQGARSFPRQGVLNAVQMDEVLQAVRKKKTHSFYLNYQSKKEMHQQERSNYDALYADYDAHIARGETSQELAHQLEQSYFRLVSLSDQIDRARGELATLVPPNDIAFAHTQALSIPSTHYRRPAIPRSTGLATAGSVAVPLNSSDMEAVSGPPPVPHVEVDDRDILVTEDSSEPAPANGHHPSMFAPPAPTGFRRLVSRLIRSNPDKVGSHSTSERRAIAEETWLRRFLRGKQQ